MIFSLIVSFLSNWTAGTPAPAEEDSGPGLSTKAGLTGLTLQEAASGMHPKWQGGADSARPYKNQFRGHFDPILLHNFDRGTKIT